MTKTPADRRWLPLNALRAFEGVAKHSSFTAAANALLISQSALSRHVISLERLIGVQLFERRPHALVLTKAGQHLLPIVTRSFDKMEYGIEELRQERADGITTLRVQMPPSFAVCLVAPALNDFRRSAPTVQIDLLSPCEVGLPPIDVDVAVIYSKPRSTGMGTVLLWAEQLTLICHPEVAAQHRGKSLAAFIASNSLIHVRVAELPRHHVWAEFVRESSPDPVRVEHGLVFDTAMLAVQCALSGEGVALVDTRLFREHLQKGSLVQPFANTLASGYGYYLVTPSGASADVAVDSFRSWLIERFS